jgi:hypothetical protein
VFFDEIHGGMSLEQDKTDGCGKLTDTDLQRALSDEKQTDILSGCQGLAGFLAGFAGVPLQRCHI